MNVLDLFSGIGGFSLGLERAGMRTIAFCEIDPYCRRVLAKYWPDVPIFGDIRELTAKALADTHGNGCGNGSSSGQPRLPIGQERGDISRGKQERQSIQGTIEGRGIDLICGGFPCQDISVAGKGAGIEGERSGLWSEYARIIGEVRPRYVIVENVAALLGRGLGRVLGDLAALGFDAEWHCIPASAVGAPHRRDRVWIVAYTRSERRQQVAGSPHGDETTHEGRAAQYNHVSQRDGQGNAAADVAHTTSIRCGQMEQPNDSRTLGKELSNQIAYASRCGWLAEPNVGRVAHGVSNRVDRLRALGNAIVPQIAEIIGRAIMSLEQEETSHVRLQLGSLQVTSRRNR